MQVGAKYTRPQHKGRGPVHECSCLRDCLEACTTAVDVCEGSFARIRSGGASRGPVKVR